MRRICLNTESSQECSTSCGRFSTNSSSSLDVAYVIWNSLPQGQKQQLETWNATDGDFPENKRLNGLFEDAAQRTPELEAVVCEANG